MINRVFALLFAGALSTTLVACDGDDTTDTEESDSEMEESDSEMEESDSDMDSDSAA